MLRWLLLLIFAIVVILGLQRKGQSEIELFDNPSVSSSYDVSTGASQLYNWGQGNNNSGQQRHRRQGKCKQCNNVNVEYDYGPVIINNEGDSCKAWKLGKCNIEDHPDITKYVLKSSVPPCADTSNFALKSMSCPCLDMSKYILKSEIPPPPIMPNMNDYILRSAIPPNTPCPDCPICPTQPKCPTLAPYPACKTIDQFNIESHPDFQNYQLKSSCTNNFEKSKDYISKDKCKNQCNNYISKYYTNSNTDSSASINSQQNNQNNQQNSNNSNNQNNSNQQNSNCNNSPYDITGTINNNAVGGQC